jgi:hypothetical protein
VAFFIALKQGERLSAALAAARAVDPDIPIDALLGPLLGAALISDIPIIDCREYNA